MGRRAARKKAIKKHKGGIWYREELAIQKPSEAQALPFRILKLAAKMLSLQSRKETHNVKAWQPRGGQLPGNVPKNEMRWGV